MSVCGDRGGRLRKTRVLTLTAVLASACGDGTTEVGDALAPATVTITPSAATLPLGGTVQFTATAANEFGHPLPGLDFVWASTNTAVATVDGSGLATAVATGSAQVTATTSGATGRANIVTETPAPTTVVVSPDSVVLSALGSAVQLEATVQDQGGRAMDGVDVAWSSADTAVARVSASGLVTARRNGVATVSARAGAAAGSATVGVVQAADSVAVWPAKDSIVAGDTLRITATAYDATGHVVEDAEIRWSSSNAAVATVDAAGLALGVGEGVVAIRAGSGLVVASAHIVVASQDRAALVAFYHAANGPNWVNHAGWTTGQPLGTWHGVTTDDVGRVTELVLRGEGWDRERREYRRHGLTGNIPDELLDLARLEVLDLRYNQLTGSIPPELLDLAGLEVLDLGYNQLTGSIPPELASLDALERLHLSANNLTGSVPPELGNLQNLGGLHLDRNRLTGSMPPDLGNLSALHRLDLSYNNLTGSIPPELANLAALQDLMLWDNSLTGSIPPGLGNLRTLISLSLGRNSLTGSIPPELADIDWLQIVSLSDNRLTGSIPAELGEMANIRYLFLANNELTGSIPAELGEATTLRLLSLSRNSLTGSIPAELGDLVEMEHLVLDANRLAGTLPERFLQIPGLVVFRVGGQDVCIPLTPAFAAWHQAIPSRDSDQIFCSSANSRSIRPDS